MLDWYDGAPGWYAKGSWCWKAVESCGWPKEEASPDLDECSSCLEGLDSLAFLDAGSSSIF